MEPNGVVHSFASIGEANMELYVPGFVKGRSRGYSMGQVAKKRRAVVKEEEETGHVDAPLLPVKIEEDAAAMKKEEDGEEDRMDHDDMDTRIRKSAAKEKSNEVVEEDHVAPFGVV
ncbi:hypothetical protein HDV05_006033 [Chytridiales sp. JEL 0842]|nr:hypothetical protein HDV05_006033 [Chytridiales sp. JEL 0842]